MSIITTTTITEEEDTDINHMDMDTVTMDTGIMDTMVTISKTIGDEGSKIGYCGLGTPSMTTGFDFLKTFF
ncbi:unnamed protein product [Caenorhabditis nigoni]